jgi:DNA (cytosine-5)-methyltransferase 1
MRHLGDITKINGYEVPVVDCVIGGSPCQDLSQAGLRKGLAGARSGLYMEQIRIVKEMRENDRCNGRTGVDVRPRYMVWENVPGAFSTNQGQDFAAVLEEAIRVAEPEAPSVSVPEKGWPTAGCFMGEQWSIAWRVLDAQFYGTPSKPLPQRRRRIALVADFGGLSAPEILFVRKSVSGDIEPGEPKRKEASGNVGEGSGGAGNAVGFPLGFRPENVRVYEETATTLCNGTRPGFTAGVIHPVYGIDQQGGKGRANYSVNVSPPILSDSHGTPHAVAYVYDARGNGCGDVCCTITGDHQNRITDYTAVVMQPVPFEPGIAKREGGHIYDGVCGTLRANAGDNQMSVAYYEQQAFGKYKDSVLASSLKERDYKDATDLVLSVDLRNATEIPGQNITLQSSCYHNLNSGHVVRVKSIVRRLTPLECERLQGFPDGWTDIGEWVDSKGKKHKEADSPRHKALGNSIAIPPWKWVLKRLCACYERDATMASLFDGIGGFPYIWEQLNGKGSCLWVSEIEEFPIAVTKLRFGGNDNV